MAMSFVNSQHLHQLRCLKCRRYLSNFPIFQSFDQQGCICGRCSPSDNSERNIVYEEIASIQKFPCCYDENGCLDNLYPNEVPFHEKFCKFRIHDCPASGSRECKWRGLIKDMWEHFKRQHATLAMTGKAFEIDLLRNYNENYLLNVDDELYIVNQKYSKDQILSFNVLYVGTNTQSQSYSYEFTFTSTNIYGISFTVGDTLEEEKNIERNFIMDALGNPSTVTAQVQIVKPDHNNEDHFEEVQWKLLEELECSYCFDYLLPPVQQCITGHSICSSCKMQQSSCPTCTKDFKDTINITLGKLIEHLVYPCKNEGCKFTCKAKDIKQHQSNCIFGKIKCPLHDYEDCTEYLPYSKLYDHILNSHYENLLEMDTVSVPFKIHREEDVTDTEEEDDENLYEDCFILRYDSQLFKLHYRYDSGELQWEMQQIGAPAKDQKYAFEIDIIDNVSKERICFKTECSTLSDKTEAFAEGKPFIFIDIDQIYFLMNDEVTYSVRILPN